MKTKIIKNHFVVVLLAITGFGISKSIINKNTLSDIAFNNIEALADYEIIVGPFCMHIYPMPLCEYFPDEGIILFGVPYNG
jgi:hypothetical protein